MPSGEEETLVEPKTSIEQHKIRDPEDGSATCTGNLYVWQPIRIDSENSEFDLKMSESHLHYYPEHGSSLPDYLQEGIPEVQEYSMSYHTSSTSTNGHGDGDTHTSPSPPSTQALNSQSPAPVDASSLISRKTSQTKTQQVKTVTKVIKTREVLQHGSDGKPIYSPYYLGGAGGPPDYLPYPTNASEFDYGTYDPSTGRPPSPAGQTPQVYEDYSTYSQTASPGSAGRNFELYSHTQPGQPYSDYVFRGEIPPQTHPQTVTTPSPLGATDSPNLHRAMPQAPTRAPQYNHQPPANYEDIDEPSGLVPPPRLDFRRTPPSPTQSDRYAGTYGYTVGPVPATSPGYQYDPGLPEGYLDPRRPSFDDPNAATYASRGPGYEESDHPVPPRHHLDYAPVDGGEGGDGMSDVRWRDPDVHEVIEFLHHSNSVVRANAAAYLTHLCYMDDAMKQKTRALGGIPPLIDMLNHDTEITTRNALGALRNLSYGRQNDENKRAIVNADGISALVRLLKKTPENQVLEYATGILWNLSSCEDLKRLILDNALHVLVNNIIIPQSGWDRSRNPLDVIKPTELYFSTVFRNASGVLRNISSAGEYARKKLRVCEGLIESLVYLVRAALSKGDMDNKCVENCVCTLRNLSYRCQEVEDPDYDKHFYPASQSRVPSGPLKAVGENLGCFGAKKKKESLVHQNSEKQQRRDGVPLTKNPIGESGYIGGMQLLWQPEVCHVYLSLLSESANEEVLEASAGALQNLTACAWRPSIEIRASVRMDKGLPVLVELLRIENDRVVATVATALLNLSKDQRNKDLIGNYALKDLVLKLPSGGVCPDPSPLSQNDTRTSDDTIAAVLATLNEVVAKQSDFARSLIQLGGVERLTKITTSKNNTYSTRVVKFASQLLFNMYSHAELRESLKRAGYVYKESNFVPKSLGARNLSSPTGANSTISRPVSSTGGTKYEDRTLPHGTELNSTAGVLSYSRSEELPLSELSHSTEPPPSSQIHRPPHMGVFPPGMQQARSPTEPVYAQVNREKKKGRHSDIPVQLLSNDQSDSIPAGDSWV